MTEFVHLHNHTDFSLLDGAAPIARYAAKCSELGMKAIAITDHGNMFGAIEFYKSMQKAGIQPIIGCEFYMCPEGRTSRGRRYHLILLAITDKGYHNLMELNSIAWVEGFYVKPRIDRQALETHSEGLICLSACLAGEIPQLLLSSNPDDAYETARWYKNLFGDRYYIEIQDHGIDEERQVLPALVKLASDLDIKIVATNDCHYIEKSDANAHDILLCIGTGKKKADEDRLRFQTDEFYMKSGDEMAQLFRDYPQAIENTLEIAQRCSGFKIEFPGPVLPEVDPAPYSTTAEMITVLAWEGLERRYPGYRDDGNQRAVLEKRLSYELGVILKMGFDSYFLIVRDYIYWAKTHGIPVGAGRGSGAGSLVAYCIDITNVDPIKHDLLFERFLNPERVSLPDFDVDFCYEGRQDVINYVTRKYGKDRVGQIATFGTLKAKAVVKDVARVLDIPFDESNLITKFIPDVIPITKEDGSKENAKVTLTLALDNVPELREFRERGGIYEELFDVSLRLENLSRHVSTHACGVVIGKTALKDYVPLYRDPKTGGISTQYTMTVIEECGLVKMDFLGLKTLTLLKNTVNLVRKVNPDFDLESVPFDDADTYAMMARGESTMVFQFESPGMQKNLRLLSPTRFEELDAMTSLYRPGPMDFIPQYIDCKQGRKPIEYPDQCLVDLLKPTYGVMVYQEQVMKTAQLYAGFSLAEADILRKVMGKKKKKEIPVQEEKFVAGALKKGHSEEDARELFEHIKPFAGYGFNKSHSVCYTVLSYRTAYLKCHYPAEFYAANLTNEISSGNTFKEYLEFVKGQGIRILPPDINNSDLYFNVVNGDIVYGLVGLKGVGSTSVSGILEERKKNGPYKDFLDFVRRNDSKVLSSSTIEALICGGAFDSLGANRPTLMANYEDAVKSVQKDREALDVGQNMLFGSDETGFSSFEMRPCPEWSFMDKLEREKEYLGFYLSGHPLDAYKTAWSNCVRLNLAHQDRIAEGVKYDFIGMVTEVKSKTTKDGTKKMGFVTMEDYNGKLDVTVFPKQWALYEVGIAPGKVMGFHGSFKEFNGRMGFSADTIYGDPAQMKPSKPEKVCIECDRSCGNRAAVIEMRDVLRHHRGSAEVVFCVYSGVDDDGNLEGKPILIAADSSFNADASHEMISQLKECASVVDVYCQ